VLQNFRVFTHPSPTYLIDGDNVAVQWTFDMIDRNGTSRRLEEVALQKWAGDRVIEERFFYSRA
jgi:hypothetical protein